MKITTMLIAVSAACSAFSADLLVKEGDVFAFLGDSITQFGQDRKNPDGYVNLVLSALREEGAPVKAIRAGISGHKSDNMLARLDRDVLRHHPKFMTLSVGVNDVWHQDMGEGKGVKLEDYKKNVSAIFDKCAASNCTVVVLTATMFEHGKVWSEDPHNVKLAPYNQWLREEAARRKLPLADLNALMWENHAKDPKARLTADGVHMAKSGNRLMAKGVLKALGVDESRFDVIERDAWTPVWVLCRFDLKPETDPAEYAAATKALLPKVLAEEGCREYRLLGPDGKGLEKSAEGATLWMFEQWDSRAHLKAHGESAHMRAFCEKIAPLRRSATVTPLEDVCR